MVQEADKEPRDYEPGTETCTYSYFIILCIPTCLLYFTILELYANYIFLQYLHSTSKLW